MRCPCSGCKKCYSSFQTASLVFDRRNGSVPLALWSSKVPDDSQQELADRLLAVRPDATLTKPQNRYGTCFGKPKFPSFKPPLSSKLADFVGCDSWHIFELLQLNSGFLAEAVTDWPHSDAYKSSLSNLNALNVVNDCSVKM